MHVIQLITGTVFAVLTAIGVFMAYSQKNNVFYAAAILFLIIAVTCYALAAVRIRKRRKAKEGNLVQETESPLTSTDNPELEGDQEMNTETTAEEENTEINSETDLELTDADNDLNDNPEAIADPISAETDTETAEESEPENVLADEVPDTLQNEDTDTLQTEGVEEIVSDGELNETEQNTANDSEIPVAEDVSEQEKDDRASVGDDPESANAE